MEWKELESETTETLIQYIQWRSDPELKDAADAAFHAFCFRFQKDVAHKCLVICRNRGYDKEIAYELAQRTFERFLKYPNFDFSKSRAKDFDNGVKLYLYRFAFNLLNDMHHEQNNPNPNPYTGEEDLVYDIPDIPDSNYKPEQLRILKEKRELIQKALERLGPKHKIIYLTYQQFAEKGFKLPRHLTEKLRMQLGLTQATIQFYKKEAFDRIAEYLEIYGSK
ncbi:RNA polymerase sigma factor [Olivibacter sitiensis]|uniref:RNA polymerase sigma factor n=1 Tax=Olivibacter sitiensis TaxID=376470 RepID=UPI000428C7A0|nr:sigma-70 family RNA polymerase sigma factor [Olivibacter sitiensis]